MTHFVLVHGGWHGAWCWDRVAAGLRARGHDVWTPTLTGMGERAHLFGPGQNLSTHIADVVHELRFHDLTEVTLVGHSYGGAAITGAADAESDRIERMVYLDAAIPADGQSCYDLAPTFRDAFVGGAAADGWSVPPAPASAFEVNKADRDLVDERLTPMTLASFLERIALTGAVDRIARKELVLATGWAMNCYLPQADLVRDKAGWTLVEVDSGHDLMIDRPDWVIEYLTGSA